MTLNSVLAWLEALALPTAIRQEGSLFPWIESVHVLAIVIVVGFVFAMDLRLLGLAGRGRAVGRVLGDATPYVWGAFAVALISGSLLFSSSARTYAANPAFQLKFAAMIVAGVNMAVFHGLTLRGGQSWEDGVGAAPLTARVAGAISMLCWVFIVGAGRWIGFLA
jgi:thiosulfate reductase cytochrome b subunit